MIRLLPFFLLMLICTSSLFAQNTQTTFGKNRVQYHEFEWKQYESRNFVTYWYGDNRNLAQSVVQMAEMDFEEIQNLLEHRINRKIELLVFTDLTDIKQSNIGMEETFNNTGGRTKIVENKVFVYFDGNHRNLLRQVREGIAAVYLNTMLFGTNLQEIVQNAVLLNLPNWFTSGLIEFVGEEWNTTLDNQLRDIIKSNKYKDFNSFAREEPLLAGHSMWYFVAQNYGKSTVSNLLYLTRINRNVESGYLYVLGTSYEQALEDWRKFFIKRYKKELRTATIPKKKRLLPIKNKRKLPLTQLKISPDGKRVAYVTNEIGRYKVYIQEVKTGKRQLIFKGSFRNPFQETDYVYPLLSWSPNNSDLAIIYEKKDIIKSRIYSTSGEDPIDDVMPSRYQRILNIDYINTNELLLTAMVGGYSDIFIYKLNTRQSQRITNDFYDDLGAVYFPYENKKGILFASNRPDVSMAAAKIDTILPLGNFDIFYFNFENGNKEAVRVTDTPLGNERNPIMLDSLHFAFVSDETGIYNQYTSYLEDYIAYYEKQIFLTDGSDIIINRDSTLNIDEKLIDSVNVYPVYKKRAINGASTNYKRNIQLLTSSPRSNRIARLYHEDGLPKIYFDTIQIRQDIAPLHTSLMQQKMRLLTNQIKKKKLTEDNKKATSIKPPAKEVPKEKNTISINPNYFQTDFPYEDELETPEVIAVEEQKKNEVLSERPPTIRKLAPKPQLETQVSSLRFRTSRITPYRLKFRTNSITTQVDNNPLFGGLDSYSGDRLINGGQPQAFNYRPPGILFKGSIQDLFEDYELEAGLRLPTTFNGMEYFIQFKDNKKQLDKYYAYYRRTQSRNINEPYNPNNPLFQIPNPLNPNLPLNPNNFTPYRVRAVTDLALVELRYPLDIFTSIRGTFTFRNDKSGFRATDAISLYQPNENVQRVGLKLEYVFDNTLDVATNIKNGTRYKAYAEVVKSFQVQLLDEFQWNFNKGVLALLGFDARHYQRLGKHSVLAGRLAGATSFGSEKILFFMGGVDNWLFPSANDNIPTPVSGDFAFQTLAANMRGFQNNIRNGNSFILGNVELRVPVFKYLYKRPIRSSFLRDFQLIGFFDIGTAWEGNTPYRSDNPLNTVLIGSSDIIQVEVNYFRDPIVMSYGTGLRTTLFGYFIRIDYGWGIETRIRQKPRWHFSLGTDF